ncbi:MAG: hypothetical protein AAF772_02220 [Acidobacteriota bacterium]
MRRRHDRRPLLTAPAALPTRRVGVGPALLLLLAASGGLAAVPAIASPSASAVVDAPATSEASAADVTFHARAYDLKTGAPIYTEHHTEHWRDGRHVGSSVRYTNPDGETFASKSVDYASGITTPTFALDDERSGYREGADVDGRKVTLFKRADERARPARATVRLPRQAVIDAGFDHFVRRNWATLLSGRNVKFEFAVASRRDFMRFRLTHLGSSTHDGRPVERFEMVSTNPIVRLLLDPILLEYDAETQRLWVYEGLSNLASNGGDRNFDARIVFNYGDVERDPLVSTAVRAAR